MSRAHVSSYIYDQKERIISDPSTVAYFPFDENYNDIIGGISPITPLQDDLFRDGKFGKAIIINDVNGSTITQLNTPRYFIPYPMKTVSLWFRFVNNKIMKGTPRTIFCVESNSGDSIRVYQEKVDDPGITLEIRYDGGVVYKTVGVEEFNPQVDRWNMLVIETSTLPYYNLNMQSQGVSGFVTRMWLNDKRYEIEINKDRTFTGSILLGYHPDTLGTNETGNVIIDELVIRNKEYSPEEIQSWYYSTMELYDPYDYYLSAE